MPMENQDLAVALKMADDLVGEIGNTHKYHCYRELTKQFMSDEIGGTLKQVCDMLDNAKGYACFTVYIGNLDSSINEILNRKEKMDLLLQGMQTTELGNGVMNNDVLRRLRLQTGCIDLQGTFHDFHDRHHTAGARENLGRLSHDDVAEYLAEQQLINDYFIRVGTTRQEGLHFAPEAVLRVSNLDALLKFTLNEPMAFALYNGVQSQKPDEVFEKNLANFAYDFGFDSRKLKSTQPIFDKGMYNRNMDILQSTVGRKRFDKKLFTAILTENTN
jgi:hypothetical protein